MPMVQPMSRCSGLYAAISPPRMIMLTSGPLRPSLRVGTGAAAAVELFAGDVVFASSAFDDKAGAKATPTGAIMALRRKLRRDKFELFLALMVLTSQF